MKKTTAVNKDKKQTASEKLYKYFPWLLAIGGIIGGLAAAILTVEKIELLKHPHAQLACDLNPIVACGSVINTHQASAFGFPNPIIGMIGFGIVTTIGFGLLAGAKFKRWFWLGLQLGTLFGVSFITWLQFQSIYRIGALCPFCMVVWTVTIPMFIYTLVYNLREGHIVPHARLKGLASFIEKHHADILLTWYVAILIAIFTHFWYYWSTLI